MPQPLPPIHAQTLEPLYQAPQPPVGLALTIIGIGLVLAAVLVAALRRTRTADRAISQPATPPPNVQPQTRQPAAEAAELIAHIDRDPGLTPVLTVHRDS